MSALRRAGRDTFRALRARNYRLFVSGQMISVTGTWMQTVAQAWLVLRLTNSGLALGIVTALQFVPMLVLGPWAGLVADRSDKRRLLLVTQSAAAALALLLGLLTVTGTVELWMVYMIAFSLGVANAFDMPTRQAFVHEMVGRADLANAVTLNSVVMNVGRLAGPAIGGLLIATVGLGACFLLNAFSYVGPLLALGAMRPDELHRVEPAPRAPGQLRQGLRYAWSDGRLRTPLLLVAVVGTFAYEFQISLPLLARFTFGADAGGYGLLLSAMSLGAVLGGLLFASRLAPSHVRLGWAGVALGVVMVMVSMAPTLGVAAMLLPVAGLASIVFITQANASLQLSATPEMRARVIALFGVAFLGSTPLGGPIVGWIGQQFGGRAPLVVGGVIAISASLVARHALAEAEAAVTDGGGEAVSRPEGSYQQAAEEAARSHCPQVAGAGAPARPQAVAVAPEAA